MYTGLWTSIIAMSVLFGGLILERVLLSVQVGAYFRLGVPLGPKLAAIQRTEQPLEGGDTRSVRWVVRDDVVRFWAVPGNRAAPMGLRGQIAMRRVADRLELDVRWSPPVTLPLGALWLILLGVLRGEGWLTVPIGVAMLLGIGVLYWRSAVIAARELRWAFVKGDE